MIELIHNLALLVALSVVSGFVGRHSAERRRGALAQGLLFGGAAVASMLDPLHFATGIQFDSRSVALCICGLYFGPAATGIAGGMAAVYRLSLGGPGALTGILVIITSAALGLAARHRWGPSPAAYTPARVWGLGLAVHAAMLLLMFTLPGGAALRVLPEVGAMVMICFPFAAVLIGAILTAQHSQRQFLHQLQESNERFRTTLYSIGDGVITTDDRGRVREMNPIAENLTGWGEAEARGRLLEDVFAIINEESRHPVENPARRVLQVGQIVSLDNHTLLVARDGRERPIADSGAPIVGVDGTMSGVVLVFRDQSDERAAGRAIRDARERFERALENIPDVVVIYDRHLRIQYINEATRGITGRSTADLIGRRDDEIWPPEVCNKYIPVLQNALVSRLTQSVETDIDLPGGGRSLLITCVPVLDADGEVLELLGITRDLTARKKSEAALRVSELRFRNVFDLQFQFMAILAPDGRLLEINDLPLQIAAIDRETVLGKPFWDTTWWRDLPDMREAWPARLKAAAAADGPVLSLDLYQDGSGTIRSADVALTAVREADGTLDYFIVQANDVTERNQVREELLASKNILEKIFASLSEAVLLVDGESRLIVQCNPAVERVFGYTPDDLSGRSDRVLFPGDGHYHEMESQSAAALERGEIFRADYALQQITGSQIDAEIAVTRVPADRDGSGQVVLVVRDISDRKRAEIALRKSEALLRIAGRVAQVGGWILDLPEGRITWSEEVRAIHELPTEYVPTFEEGLEHFPPEWRDLVAGALEACKRDGTPFDLELELITAHRRRIWVRTIGQAVRDESGEIVRVEGAFQDISQLKDVESSLARSQARFRQLADAMPLIVWTAGPDGVVDYASDAFARYTGQPGAGELGETWLQVVHPDDLDRARRVWAEAFKRGDNYVHEFRILRHDGEYCWNHLQATPIRDDSGSIVKWYGTATDIHDTKLNEEAMTRMAARLTATLESITDAFYTLDREWRFTYLNPEAERLLKRPKEALLGKVAGREFKETIGSDVDQNFSRAARENCTVDFETYYAPLDCWFELHVYPSEEGLAVYFRDITERVEAERQLRAVSERLQSILDFSPLLITELDLEGRYLLANNAACAALECPPGDLEGKTLHDLMPADTARLYLRRIGTILETRESVVVEDRLDFEGAERIFSTVLFPLFDARGAIFSVGGIAQEITDRKNAEIERERLEAQLRQAQKMEAVGRLAGGVAHDFNNMLGVILGYTDMALLNIGTGDPLAADLEQVQLAATRSADLTRQLLAFARKQTIAPKVLDLNETVASILKMLGRLIGEDIDLIWKPGARVWPVRVDPTQIDQVLANLIVNARDAIAGIGKITITTGTTSFDRAYSEQNPGAAPGHFSTIAISDDGCGMDSDTLAQIFEPFFTTKPHGKGTGLGLATVYGIVKQNDGFVTVDSEPGIGTTFRLYLPRHNALPVKSGTAAVQRPPQAGSETILLVEDEMALLNLGKRLLERLGYTVLAAGTPADALEVARNHPDPIDLLVTDVIMPGMNGRDLWRELDTIRPGIKTLFMSGYTADVIATHGALDKGVQFLQKPFKMETMAAKVREVLGDTPPG